MIDTRMGQTAEMGKWEAACQMIRLVRELQALIDESAGLTTSDKMRIDGVVHEFTATLPKKCQDEVLHG